MLCNKQWESKRSMLYNKQWETKAFTIGRLLTRQHCFKYSWTWVSMFQCRYLKTFNAMARNFPKEDNSPRERCLIHEAHLATEGRLSKLLGKNWDLASAIIGLVHSIIKWYSSPIWGLSQAEQWRSCRGMFLYLPVTTGSLLLPVLNRQRERASFVFDNSK